MKKMKILLTGFALMSLSITACGKKPDPTPSESNSQASSQESVNSEVANPSNEPSEGVSENNSEAEESDLVVTDVTFEGLTDLSVNLGDAVNLKDGVKATIKFMEDGAEQSLIVNSYLKISQDGVEITSANTSKEGEYTLVYSINTTAIVGFSFGSDLKLTAERKMTVSKVEVSGDELITDGTFDNGGTHWASYTDGSSVEFDYSEGYMKCVQTAISPNSYSPRINTPYPNSKEAFTLQYGVTYSLSMDMKSAANKTVLVQFGTLLPSAPWWGSLNDENGDQLVHEFTIDSRDWKTYTWTFTLASNTCTETHMTFEMGTVAGDATVTTVCLDNVSLKAAVNTGEDKLPPSITGTEPLKVECVEGSTDVVDVLQGIVVTDNVDKDIVPTYVIKDKDGNTVESISKGVEGVYTVTYTATDAAGNEKTATRTIRVLKDIENIVYEPVYNSAKTNIAFSGENDKPVNTMVYWNDQNWCGQNVTVSQAYEENKEYHVSYSSTGAAFYGAGFQMFYKNDSLTDGDTYTVSLTINSTVAGAIRVNGQEINLKVGDNEIAVAYTEGVSSLAVINGTLDGTTVDAATFVISNVKWVEGNKA